ncbi:MAG: hypothetical protein U0U67_02495 [Chitinophagales bacterium]
MEKIVIIYNPSVEIYLNELIDILFQKKYFSFKENALNYVIDLIDFTENNIHSIQHKNTPQLLAHFGTFYITYKTTKRTTWYIFFNKKENRYLIKHITNNHTENATLLHSL